MNSKIVILDDSVILYQHFISDDNWETVMAFPRGGLTYLIKNDNIKFFAYIDYFYRNCLMTMDLPLYIVDEELGIDGEYSDIDELTELLNRIFPALNGDVDLTPYLKKREAAELYQPIGDYQPVGNYFDDVEYDSSGKTIDFYSQGTLVDSIDARPFIKDGMVDSVTLIELSGDTYLHIVFNTDAGKEPIDIPLGDIFDADNYYTKQEVDGLLDDKLDASAYTPTDLSNYYNKQEVDALIPEVPSLDGYATETWVKNQGYINQLKTINNISLIGEGNIQIGSGGTIDAYTKEEADERFQPKGDYVTSATVIQYITNLQEQITNIIQTVSGCCSETGETTYRWITMTGANDYVCSGTTKYTKEKKQQSTDGGMTWTDVSPAQYQRGSTILEVNSSDCGYEPTIEYRWVTNSGGYVCSGTTKYNQEKKQYRVDGGAWIDTDPLETRRGSTIIETQSTDCGYIAPQYRWYQAPASDYMCSGTSKYYKEYYQVSTDGGQTWTNVSPTQTRQGSLIEAQSTDCGYIQPQYRWYTAPASDYLCSGTSKYYKQYYQVSTDGGNTWSNVTPTQTRAGNLIEAKSTDCNYPTGTKYYGTYRNGDKNAVDCNNSSELSSGETKPGDRYEETYLSSAAIGSCVTDIGDRAFMWCTHLSSVTFSNGLEFIGSDAFESCYALTSVTFPSTLWSIGSSAFETCSGMTSVNFNNGLHYIGARSFVDCDALTTINIPDSVLEIGDLAFSACKNLTTVTIGTGLRKIGSLAFYCCLNLASFTVKATTPPAMSVELFDKPCPCCPESANYPIYVPAASLNAYKTATGWSEFADRIYPIP